MDWASVLLGGLGGGLAVYVLQVLRELMARERRAKHVAALFRAEIEELRAFYRELDFHPVEPLGISRPEIMIYAEHGAWRLFELFPRGKVATSITTFYRSLPAVHEPIEKAQRSVREFGVEGWQGLRSSSAHRRLESRFKEAKSELLKNADEALEELRAWRAALPVDIGEQ